MYLCVPPAILGYGNVFNWKKISSFLQNGRFSNLKSDTNKHLLCASLCNSVALLFFLCPSRSAGPVTKLAHLFLSALFKKAAVSRKSCTFQMLLAWNGPLIIVVLHALLVFLFGANKQSKIHLLRLISAEKQGWSTSQKSAAVVMINGETFTVKTLLFGPQKWVNACVVIFQNNCWA